MIRLLFENFLWKLLSLGLALALWLTFVSSPEEATSVSAALEFKNIPSDLDMIADAADRVHLEIQGPTARLHGVDLSRTAVELDLSGVNRPGERTFTITEDDVRLPPGLRVVRAVPAQVRIQFERRATRDIPVRIRFSHQPPSGYRIKREEVQPDTLRIVGPESRVQSVEYAETDAIDLSNVVGPAEFRVSAFVGDPQVRFQSSPFVRVKVILEKAGH